MEKNGKGKKPDVYPNVFLKREIVKSRYNEKEAKDFMARHRSLPVDLSLRIYTSCLLGGDASLVLHGGGNTSVKIKTKNILGEERDVLFVKGSGIDLRRIEPSGFVGLELEPLRRLKSLGSIADQEMENQLLIHKIAYVSPNPSVEALLHAFLPHRFIDHTHAESILILSSQTNGADILKEILGPQTGILPYCHPGFLLAKEGLGEYERNPELEALVVMGHGIFTFGEDARTSYERMVGFVDRAENFIRKKTRGNKFASPRADVPPLRNKVFSIARLAQMIRGSCAFRTEDGALRRFYTEVRNPPELIEISLLPEAGTLCSSGVLTPDHAIRTKNKWAYIDQAEEDDTSLKEKIQNVIRDYRQEYDRSFAAQAQTGQVDWKKLDSNPRVFLIAGVGLIGLGFTPRDARIAADIGERTAHAKFLAQSIGHYEPILENHVWAMEYWGLQQKKLDRPAPLALQGQIALVTGGGGAIGLGRPLLSC